MIRVLFKDFYRLSELIAHDGTMIWWEWKEKEKIIIKNEK